MTSQKSKRPITIYHVHLFRDDITVQDYYFGSISAIYDLFNKDDVGIVASSLYNLNMDEYKNPVYENKKCRIRKSSLITKNKEK